MAERILGRLTDRTRKVASSVRGEAGIDTMTKVAGLLLASPALLSAPLFLAGGLKIVYDLLLYRGFVSLAPPEERKLNDQ